MVLKYEYENKTCKEAIAYFGTDAQILKAVEELNELSLALLHYRLGKKTDLQVKNDLADVLIMCEQMCIMFDFDPSRSIAYKINRLKWRIEQEKSSIYYIPEEG